MLVLAWHDSYLIGHQLLDCGRCSQSSEQNLGGGNTGRWFFRLVLVTMVVYVCTPYQKLRCHAKVIFTNLISPPLGLTFKQNSQISAYMMHAWNNFKNTYRGTTCLSRIGIFSISERIFTLPDYWRLLKIGSYVFEVIFLIIFLMYLSKKNNNIIVIILLNGWPC